MRVNVRVNARGRPRLSSGTCLHPAFPRRDHTQRCIQKCRRPPCPAPVLLLICPACPPFLIWIPHSQAAGSGVRIFGGCDGHGCGNIRIGGAAATLGAMLLESPVEPPHSFFCVLPLGFLDSVGGALFRCFLPSPPSVWSAAPELFVQKSFTVRCAQGMGAVDHRKHPMR